MKVKTMKSSLVRMGLSALCAVWMGSVWADEPTVLAYWPFGDAGLYDVSGNGHTLEGGADVTGDHAVFGGTAATVLSTVENLDLSSYDAVTIEFFVRAKDPAQTMYLLEHTASMNANIGGFHVKLNERDPGEYRIGALMKTTSEELGIACTDTAPGPLQDGVWHHVAVVLRCHETSVYDAAHPEAWCVSVWIDGEVKRREGYRTATLAKTSAGCTFKNAKLYLGSRANTEGFFSGELDDVRITAGVLSSGQFMTERSMSSDARQEIAYYPFGTNGFCDVSGNGNHLHASATGVTLGTDGALSFAGGAAFCQTYKPLDLSAYREGLTIECFFKTASSGNGKRIPLLCHSPSLQGVGEYIFAAMLAQDRYVMTDAYKNGAQRNLDSTERLGTEAPSYADGAWHHLAWVCNPYTVNDPMRIYVDGTEVPTSASAQENYRFLALGTGFLRLGQLHDSLRYGSGNKFAGELDDVRITAAALKPDEFHTTRSEDAGTPVNTPQLEPYTLAHWKFSSVDPFRDETGLFPLRDMLTNDSYSVSFQDGEAVFTGLGGLQTRSPVDLSPYRQVTVDFWVKYPRIYSYTDYPHASIQKFDMNFVEYSRCFDKYPGSFRFSADVGYNNNPARAGVLFSTKDGYRGHLKPEGSYGDGQWHHWVYTVDMGNATKPSTLTIDGSEVARDTGAFNQNVLCPFSANQHFFLGTRYEFIDNNYRQNNWADCINLFGSLDDVRVTVGGVPSDNERSAEVVGAGTPLMHCDFESAEAPYADTLGNHNLKRDLQSNSTVTVVNGVARFAGTDGLVTTIPLAGISQKRALTVEFLFRPDVLAAGREQYIVEYGNNYLDFGSTLFYARMSPEGKLLAGFFQNTRTLAGAYLCTNRMNHVAMVMNFDCVRGCDQLNVWVNGERCAQDTTASLADLSAGVREGLYLNLGQHPVDRTKSLKGDIDAFCMTEGALTPENFKLRRAAFNADDVIAYWPFKNGAAEADASGNGFDWATVAPGTTLADDCATIHGGNGLTSVAIPFGAATNGLTVECFVRLRPDEVAANDGQVLFKSVGLRKPGTFVTEFCPAGNNQLAFLSRWYECAFYKADNLSILLVEQDDYSVGRKTVESLADGKWHHVAQVIDPSARYKARQKLYIDGEEMPANSGVSEFAEHDRTFLDGVLQVGWGATLSVDDVRITAAPLAPADFLQKRTQPQGVVVIVR